MPRNRKSPAQLATEAGDLVRSLNHATLDSGAYAYPGDVDATVQALAILTGRLPQAISQSGTALTAMAVAGRVRLDAMGDQTPLTGHLAGAAVAVTRAVHACAALESALKELGSYTCRLAFAEPQELSA
ncbi:hypothetical protein [Kitasatospora sp. NPDC056184]|uniref:hypothetical protein n=1 Tax=Kitasatospora sp. NPDC056184 TaxID=3345738 RepID=UPI0035D90AD6